ncbi:unnamed protein product [Nesidiocoris tenuis]|uniref:Uncharacterized protein n=1 Tax=Nesidiocoris tenuis TaxID=355587 RepID=A0A6H5GX58_9HEMI|nr:unnamed protein product [Nesidiocoris tenuis]
MSNDNDKRTLIIPIQQDQSVMRSATKVGKALELEAANIDNGVNNKPKVKRAVLDYTTVQESTEMDGKGRRNKLTARVEIKELADDDQNEVAAGSLGYQPWVLTSQNKEYLGALMANLVKGNEHYLATHKQNPSYSEKETSLWLQALGVISMLMYKCLEKKPLDSLLFMKNLLSSKKLKYRLNKYMLKRGYKRSPGQMEHELVFLEPTVRAQVRCSYEEAMNFRPVFESGRFSLSPYGPPLAPRRVPFNKTYSASVAHGLVPYYIRSADDEKIFIARDQAAWPSLFY